MRENAKIGSILEAGNDSSEVEIGGAGQLTLRILLRVCAIKSLQIDLIHSAFLGFICFKNIIREYFLESVCVS